MEDQHINQPELQATSFVLQHWPLIRGRHVLMRTDIGTTVADINRLGRAHSAAMLRMVETLWLWASEHLLLLKALHIPRSGK